ncbi:MAG TPA: precorrin-8X methylmutase [Candidatus Methanoperedenaceae archaeon]|nr:precorrin-8X methylmutase [Candidatus Methanoperedenaceae archaeon]
MNTEFGALTREAKEISRKSSEIARRIVGGNSPEDMIRQRCVIATGDPSFAKLMRFEKNAVGAGIDAIASGALIFTDIKMAEVGISKRGHACSVESVVDKGNAIAEAIGVTRTSAGFMAVRDRLDGSIVVIGNAPSAAITVCNLVNEGVKPALIVATPVGFVNAAESKEMVRLLDIPSITCEGTRGGTPVAVAVVNGLIEMSVCATR